MAGRPKRTAQRSTAKPKSATAKAPPWGYEESTLANGRTVWVRSSASEIRALLADLDRQGDAVTFAGEQKVALRRALRRALAVALTRGRRIRGTVARIRATVARRAARSKGGKITAAERRATFERHRREMRAEYEARVSATQQAALVTRREASAAAIKELARKYGRSLRQIRSWVKPRKGTA
jgi:hypothetical protein